MKLESRIFAFLVIVSILFFESTGFSLFLRRHTRKPQRTTVRSTIPQSSLLLRSARASAEFDGSTTEIDSNESPIDRRRAFRLISAMALSSQVLSMPANAYKKEFPSELDTENGDYYKDGREKMLQDIRQREYERTASVAVGPWSKPLASFLWGAALWFLSGSRSNPLITPVANVLYDEKKEVWLKDRNDGLFSDFPGALYGVMVLVFVCLGFLSDTAVTELAEGERNISLQLAGVSLISGASLELGRIASGEKKQTREESDRDSQLVQEFNEFADNRLRPGGNCHRNEVVAAFRRYYAKYRQADSPDYPLLDLEIEQLLRSWGRRRGIEMSSAGFYNGVQINTQADAFVKR